MRTAAMLSIAAALALGACAVQTAEHPADTRAFVVYFQGGSAELTPEAREIVAEIAGAARNSERPEIVVEGVADRDRDGALTARREAAIERALHEAGVADAMVTLRDSNAAGETGGIAARRVKITLVAQQD